MTPSFDEGLVDNLLPLGVNYLDNNEVLTAWKVLLAKQ